MERLRLGIAGLGTVGTGVLDILNGADDGLAVRAGKRLEVVAVSARSKNKEREALIGEAVWYDDALQLAHDDAVDVVVELIGGDTGVAADLCEQALQRGKHVVTANKALIASHGDRLARLAAEQGVALCFEAAVAGGIPILKALREGLAANEVQAVAGILNGTGNYILTAMQESGSDFNEVLAEAQRLGYAEADPSFDVDGIDTAHKLAILTALAFGGRVDLDAVYVEGIRDIALLDIHYARELGYCVKLLGLCQRGAQGISQAVYPCLVPESSVLAHINGVDNAVMVVAEPVGQVLLSGPGAGAGATASSVVADVVDIACGRGGVPFGRAVDALEALSFASIGQREGRYYVRFTVQDETGVLAQLTEILRQGGISMEALVQKSGEQGEVVHIVGVTHVVSEGLMQAAVEQASGLAFVKEAPKMLRIESFLFT